MSDNTPNIEPSATPNEPQVQPEAATAPEAPQVTTPAAAEPAQPQAPQQPEIPVQPQAPQQPETHAEPGAPYTAPAAPAPGYGAPQAPAYGQMPPAPGYGQAPGYPQAPGYGQVPAAVPGKTMGIVGLILAFIPGISFVGLILSIVGLVQSKKAGAKNVPAIVGIVIGAISLIIGIIVTVLLFGAAATSVEMLDACLNGATSVEVMGQTVSCEQFLAEY